MKRIALPCLLLLSSCTPSAWQKPGLSLEAGDQAYAQCEREVDARTPSADFYDVSVTVTVNKDPYNDFSTRVRLENKARDAAATELQNVRRDIVAERSRQCMTNNGWQEVDDPR